MWMPDSQFSVYIHYIAKNIGIKNINIILYITCNDKWEGWGKASGSIVPFVRFSEHWEMTPVWKLAKCKQCWITQL